MFSRNKNLTCLTLVIIIHFFFSFSALGTGDPFSVRVPGTKDVLYAKSYALLIDSGDYTNGWPKLDNVPKEHDVIERALKNHGFHVQRRRPKSREELKSAIRDFINEFDSAADNRLLFFFSGHGYTTGSEGYFVPADAPKPKKNQKEFFQKALSIYDIAQTSRQLTANHALFVFDSCLKGPDLLRNVDPELFVTLSESVTEHVREFIISGSSGQKLPPQSLFAQFFADALNGAGDINQDGYITGVELGSYLYNKLLDKRPLEQTTQHGKIPNIDRGDILFLNFKAKLHAEGTSKDCLQIKGYIPEYFPISLLNSSLAKEREFLYWFYLEAENECPKKIKANITFDAMQGPIKIKKIGTKSGFQKFTIPVTKKGEKFRRNVKLPITFTKTDFNRETHVRISWRIEDHKGNPLGNGDKPPIEVLPKNVFFPELQSIEGTPAKPDFVIASISAWVHSNEKNVIDRSDKEITNIIRGRRPLTPEEWFKQCYASLFWKTGKIDVIPPPFSIPLTTRRKIRTPGEILTKKRANHLEISLLLAAMSKIARQDIPNLRPALIYLTEDEKYLFAWQNLQKQWQAININKIHELSFDSNTNQASDGLRKILENSKNLTAALADTGVFLSPNIIAIDFYRTQEGPFKIMGLP